MDLWAYANDVTLDFSRPGKPTDSGFIEAFNSKSWPECLNVHWLMDLVDAREKLEAWHRDYNKVRPHSAIGSNVLIDLHIPGGAANPPRDQSRETPERGGPESVGKEKRGKAPVAAGKMLSD